MLFLKHNLFGLSIKSFLTIIFCLKETKDLMNVFKIKIVCTSYPFKAMISKDTKNSGALALSIEGKTKKIQYLSYHDS